MAEREMTPEVEKLLEASQCTLIHYEDASLGIEVDLLIPGRDEIERIKQQFKSSWKQVVEFRWTVLQEKLQGALKLKGRKDLWVTTAHIERENPSPEQIVEDLTALSSTSGDLPKPIAFPMINPDTLNVDGNKIKYICFSKTA